MASLSFNKGRHLVSQQDSAIVAQPHIPRSKFLNHWQRLTTFDAGYLVPFLVDDILPGDHVNYDVSAYIRMSTPLFPIFSNQRVDTFFFFVPYRLVWTSWKQFMGEQQNPSSSITYTVPRYTSAIDGDEVCSLSDYFGLPVKGQIAVGDYISYSALPFRAYCLIWNEWFRDENVQNSIIFPTDNTNEGSAYYNPGVKRRNKSPDYFASALPWTQKFTAPTIALSGYANVLGIGAINATGNAGPLAVTETPAYGSPTGISASYSYYKNLWDAAAINQAALSMSGPGPDAEPQVYADLATATGVAINALRQAFMVQSLLEKDARGGTRYTEVLRQHFGVISPDARLQRPEYIGGGQSPLNITPIAQTAPSAGLTVGALGAAGTSAGTHRASYASTEHGVIIGIINVKTEQAYQGQGVRRYWLKSTRYEWYWPSLAEMGEMAIATVELYTTGNAYVPTNAVFGYQERWHEYRTRYSEITGVFKSYATGTLDAWHLAQNFTAEPTLSSAFLEDNPPMSRVLAAGATASKMQYLADIQISRNITRPVNMFGTPANLGRF